MTILRNDRRRGIDVHFEPDECQLFMQLAADAEKAAVAAGTASAPVDRAPTYFTVSLAIGRQIRSLNEAHATADRFSATATPLVRSMIELILPSDLR
jgi:hypothetical protein